MKKFYLTLCAALAIGAAANAQCNGGRYANTVFKTATVTSGVTYGSNTTYTGSTQTLTMDIYQPTGDTAKARPLIIWVHGGSFLGGSSTDGDVSTLSDSFAVKGYVCASINYRLGMAGIDSAQAILAVIRAVQDLKASVRFFYKDRKTTNTYMIDTNHIYIGGASAGALTALHAAYLKRDCQIVDPGYITDSALTAMGGLEGTSGNAGYSDRAAACISLCGALGHYNWIEMGDMPLCSMHGTSDAVVIYGRGKVNPGIPLMYLDGDRILYAQAKTIALADSFYTWVGAPHVPFDNSVAYMDTTIWYVRDFLVGQLGCTGYAALQKTDAPYGAANLYSFPTCPLGIPTLNSELVSNMYPNPSRGEVTLQLAESHGEYNIQISDISGRIVSTSTTSKSTYTIERAGLTAGVYFVRVADTKGNTSVKKLIFY
jgi:para-nitrobenzyl esterase